MPRSGDQFWLRLTFPNDERLDEKSGAVSFWSGSMSGGRSTTAVDLTFPRRPASAQVPARLLDHRQFRRLSDHRREVKMDDRQVAVLALSRRRGTASVCPMAATTKGLAQGTSPAREFCN
jgi:hypothetical protein